MTPSSNEPDRTRTQQPHRWPGRGRSGATRSRVGSVWVAFILFAVVLLLLLIFVLQNGQRAKISYFGAHGELPQGVALLLAAVFGILLVALPGTGRILQLRIREWRHHGSADENPPTTALTAPRNAGPVSQAVGGPVSPAVAGPSSPPIAGPAGRPVEHRADRTDDPAAVAPPNVPAPSPAPTQPTQAQAQGTPPADRP